MKAIIASVLSVVIAVAGIAATVGATNNNGDGFYLSANSGSSISGWSKMGIKNGKFYIEGEQIFCFKSNTVMGGQMTTGDAKVNKPTPNLPSADTTDCNANTTINNPPANTTVTINNVCGDPAEIAKIKASSANLIINSVGPCPTNGKPVEGGVKPTIINVNPNEGTGNGTVRKASATTTEPVTLPETGLSDITLATAGLAVLAYATTFAIRAFRRA